MDVLTSIFRPILPEPKLVSMPPVIKEQTPASNRNGRSYNRVLSAHSLQKHLSSGGKTQGLDGGE